MDGQQLYEALSNELHGGAGDWANEPQAVKDAYDTVSADWDAGDYDLEFRPISQPPESEGF